MRTAIIKTFSSVISFSGNNIILRNFSRPKYSYNTNKGTIFALSSGYGKCGVAVIRVSGPDTSGVISKIGGFKNIPEPRKALLRHLRDPETNTVLDHGLVIWFPGPSSFTGEDCCEFQVHGGIAVISSVLTALGKMPGLRPAEPGEFTKRAFYNGKLNLTEVEGLGDLIHAETEIQRQQALNQMDGALHDIYTSWRKTLTQSVAHVEAYIDFSEDQNIEDNILQETNETIQKLRSTIQRHFMDGRRGERTRDGVKTVIVGAPNVGKSSLLNTLCQKPAAIVSSIPGTTRDVIKTTLDIAGFPVVLSDTAGLRHSTDDIVEQEGIARAHQVADSADLILLVVDAADYVNWKLKNLPIVTNPFLQYMETYIQNLHLFSVVETCPTFMKTMKMKTSGDVNCGENMCLVVFNKLDLLGDTSEIDQICKDYGTIVAGVSCKTDNGFEALLEKLKNNLAVLCSNPSRENPSFTQARHRYHITECLGALDQYMSMSDSDREIDLAAHHLRTALNSLGKITGHVSTEHILDVIFKDFCIGK